MPPETIVPPLYVFVPLRINSSDRALASANWPEPSSRMPEKVVVSPSPATVSVTAPG
jgi:hypothetical protein